MNPPTSWNPIKQRHESSRLTATSCGTQYDALFCVSRDRGEFWVSVDERGQEWLLAGVTEWRQGALGSVVETGM
jgi:hypothetical protein